jgi:transcriptional regulator with XRE-family HTH domain
LRKTRKRQGVSQKDLAARVGSQQPQVSAWETGRKPVTVAQLARLLNALGLELRLSAEPKPASKSPDPFAAAMGGDTRGSRPLRQQRRSR